MSAAMAAGGSEIADGGAAATAVGALEVFAEVLSQSEQDPAVGDGFYDRLCEAVCRLARLRRAVIFRYDPRSRQVLPAGAHGVDLRGFESVQVSLDSAPIAIRAMRQDEVIEAAGDIRDQLPSDYAPLVSEPMRIVCAPMSAARRGVGVILAERSLDEPPLDGTERHLLWTLGKAAALASVARTVATQAETARQLRQRIDLARELHEGVIQRLFGVSMVLDGEGELPAAVRARCAAETQAALSELREAMQRPLGRGSRATPLRFEEELRRQVDLHPDLRIEYQGDAEVPAELEPLAQSILAEALRNVSKHARATSVSVATSRGEDAFVLAVLNNGVEGGPLHRPGMGLRLAAFEALQSGGVVEFGPGPARTWQVRLVVPTLAA
ncbi:MAG: GAF domain-containing sensor histidine kinase [Solirubrobacteraceae bacterium]